MSSEAGPALEDAVDEASAREHRVHPPETTLSLSCTPSRTNTSWSRGWISPLYYHTVARGEGTRDARA
jgi:hypothetical protein